MSDNGTRALDQALSEAGAALATLPDMLAASRETLSVAQARQARLIAIRAAVEGRLETAPLLRDQAADRARLDVAYKARRRAILWQIRWLWLLRVWRAVRWSLALLLMAGLVAAFLYWAFTHRDWLLDTVTEALPWGDEEQVPAPDAEPAADQIPDPAPAQTPVAATPPAATAPPPAAPVQP